MEQEIKKVNKPMFWIGIAMIVTTAIALLVIKEDLGVWPIMMGFYGIVCIGASRYRPMK